MQLTPKIPASAIIITLNEEKHLTTCLQSLSFCADIIIVDSGSIDKTTQIAKQYTEHVISHPFETYSKQKEFANSLSKHDWILSIDADEAVPNDLAEEIRCLFSDPHILAQYNAFFIPRKTFYLNQWMRHGGWYPNYLIRLFKRSSGYWSDDTVHERWESKGPTHKLNHPIHHYSFDDISDHANRNNHYTSLAAEKLCTKNISSYQLITKPIIKFFEMYLLKKGCLDGVRGLVIAVMSSYAVFLKWAKVLEYQLNSKDK